MLVALLWVPTIVIPILSIGMIWVGGGDISERHHSHHDTYGIASVFSWGVGSAIAFMGGFGILVGWLCTLSVFYADVVVVLSFFDTFLVLTYAAWLVLRRYQVVTYDDHMLVTPFFGKPVSIRYADISAMEWAKSLLIPNERNIFVFVGHRRRAMLWAAIDLEQILIRIDRFDVIENLIS